MTRLGTDWRPVDGHVCVHTRGDRAAATRPIEQAGAATRRACRLDVPDPAGLRTPTAARCGRSRHPHRGAGRALRGSSKETVLISAVLPHLPDLRTEPDDPLSASSDGPAPGGPLVPHISPVDAVGRKSWRSRVRGDAGMSTAEYAVGTVAACGFAALLWTILHSGAVQAALTGLITKALSQL